MRRHFPTFCAIGLKVKPKGGGGVRPFIFNQVQRALWAVICRLIEEGRPLFFVILKFRQVGMSTFWDAWLFWQIWRQYDIQAMIIAHAKPTAELMIETMRVFYDELPESKSKDTHGQPIWTMKPDLREGNHGATIPRGEVYFADRRAWCMIHQAKNVDPRGSQATYVLETEFAMYPNPGELNSALLPQLPIVGTPEFLRCTVVIESTPKGQNEFYDKYHANTPNNSQLWTSVGRIRMGRLWTTCFFPWFIFDEQLSLAIPTDKEGKVLWKMSKEERQLQRYLSRIREGEFDGKPVTDEQMYWRRFTIDEIFEGDEDKFNQEYPTDDEECFLVSSRSIFRPYTKQLTADVREANERAVAWWHKEQNRKVFGPLQVKLTAELERRLGYRPDVQFVPHPHGKWTIWEGYNPAHKYIIGADPAVGLEGGSLSAAYVMDVHTAWQVAEYCQPVGPQAFAKQLALAGWYYGNALLVPEVNNVGYVVLADLIKKYHYGNLYRWPKFDEVNTYTKKRGFVTNEQTKFLLVASLKHYIEEMYVRIASRMLLAEMSTFEHTSEDEFRAQRGRRDDRVMAMGLAIMGVLETPKLAHILLETLSKVPSAYDLGIAAQPSERQELPQQIAELIVQKSHVTYPWNPMRGEDDLF